VKSTPDEVINMDGRQVPALINPSVSQHVNKIGDYFGKISAQYLQRQQ
jgi:hypothetical protein